MPDNPEKEPSEEVDENQLQMARTEGEAYHSSATYMMTKVADNGDIKEVGDYFVGFAQEEAESMWELQGEDDFELIDPGENNCHIEVVVTDRADKRFVPSLDVTLTLEGEGETVGPVEVPFLWHPGLYHYGRNLQVPGEGTYDLHIEIAPPTFKRHDKENGDRYGETVETTFEDVEITTGQG